MGFWTIKQSDGIMDANGIDYGHRFGSRRCHGIVDEVTATGAENVVDRYRRAFRIVGNKNDFQSGLRKRQICHKSRDGDTEYSEAVTAPIEVLTDEYFALLKRKRRCFFVRFNFPYCLWNTRPSAQSKCDRSDVSTPEIF